MSLSIAECPEGMFKEGYSNDACASCPEYSFTNVTGSASCQCVEGRYRGTTESASLPCACEWTYITVVLGVCEQHMSLFITVCFLLLPVNFTLSAS